MSHSWGGGGPRRRTPRLWVSHGGHRPPGRPYVSRAFPLLQDRDGSGSYAVRGWVVNISRDLRPIVMLAVPGKRETALGVLEALRFWGTPE